MFKLVKVNKEQYKSINSKIFWGTINGKREICLTLLTEPFDEELKNFSYPLAVLSSDITNQVVNSSKKSKGYFTLRYLNPKVDINNPEKDGVIKLGDDFHDLRKIQKLHEKFPNATFVGGFLLRLEGFRLGYFDEKEFQRVLGCRLSNIKDYIYENPIDGVLDFSEIETVEQFIPSECDVKWASFSLAKPTLKRKSGSGNSKTTKKSKAKEKGTIVEDNAEIGSESEKPAKKAKKPISRKRKTLFEEKELVL